LILSESFNHFHSFVALGNSPSFRKIETMVFNSLFVEMSMEN
jgi:hypothetical protein